MISHDQLVMVAATLSAGMDISAEEAVDRAEAIIAEVEKRGKEDAAAKKDAAVAKKEVK